MSLVVDYEDDQDFLLDYEQNLSRGEGLVQAARMVEPGTQVQLGLSFPGLVEPIIVEGVVGDHHIEEDAAWMRVNLLGPPARLATIVERIRARDRRMLVPVIKVLIAEDNVHVSELVKNGLNAAARREIRDRAFWFETALDGAAALELLKSRKFDAAIIDVYLPVLDGAALIRQLRSTLGLSLPVIGLSGGGEAARRAALGAGATAFLDKPIQLRRVLDTLRSLITV